jgi:hypothetical protein
MVRVTSLPFLGFTIEANFGRVSTRSHSGSAAKMRYLAGDFFFDDDCRSLPHHVPVVLDVMGQAVCLDGLETCLPQICVRSFFSPHRS